MNFTHIGGRRFVLAMSAGCMTTFLQYTGHLDAQGSTYAMVIIATVGAYIGGQAYETKATGTKPGLPK
jgi:hypothetical protein